MSAARRRTWTIAALALLACAGCGGSAPLRATEVEVRGAWARVVPPGASAGAAYLTLRSAGGDRLLGVEADPERAAAAELHETVPGPGGQLRMRRVEALVLRAGTPVALAPGGRHIMLFGLKRPLAEGDTLTLRLRFERAGARTVRVPVRRDGG